MVEFYDRSQKIAYIALLSLVLALFMALALALVGAAHAAGESPALAMRTAPAMRTLDLTVLILDENGHEVPDPTARDKDDPTCKKCPALTVGRVLSNALFAPPPPPTKLPIDEVWARGILANDMRQKQSITLREDQIKKLKDVIVVAYPEPIIVEQVMRVLDPDGPKPEFK